MEFEVNRVTHGPKHHLFGFHDLVQTNAKGDLALSLEMADISHPPLPGETCGSGIVECGEFREIHRTRTWNYPQGARQQWIGDSDMFTCNDRMDDGRLVARVCDGRSAKVVETLPFPIHCIAGDKAVFFDYDRVHAVGGYGYTPLSVAPPSRLEDWPADDGIWVGDIKSGKRELLVSIAEVAACGERHRVRSGYPHYVTHAMLNPSGTRLAFLHRYRVVDGGEPTRLMTVGLDGGGLRCLAKGFLSHFTWIGDDELFIWGEDQRALCAVRESSYLRIPGVYWALLVAKRIIRSLRARRQSPKAGGAPTQSRTFLIVRDCENPTREKSGVGVLLQDGHPMAQPGNLRHLICDTYWDQAGDRTLFFYDVDEQRRMVVGKYRMIFDRPDETRFDWRAAQAGIDSRILRKFDRGDYLFFRSGFHCDLHPRWSHDGMIGYFDSIHEGTRQIYSVKVRNED